MGFSLSSHHRCWKCSLTSLAQPCCVVVCLHHSIRIISPFLEFNFYFEIQMHVHLKGMTEYPPLSLPQLQYKVMVGILTSMQSRCKAFPSFQVPPATTAS